MSTDVIINTEMTDLESIYQLFEEAIAYQKRNGYPVWHGYDKRVLITDIDYNLQYKLLNGGEIAYLFSICYSDKLIWREKDRDDAIYLHRMVVNQKFKGQKNFGKVLAWIREHCEGKSLRFIRMDTWADNPKIISYYKSFGFHIAGYFTTPDTEELPIQQRNNEIVLLEVAI